MARYGIRYGLVETVPPAIEPVTLDEVKLWSRVDIADDDAIFASLITGARVWCEQWLGRTLITRTYRMTLDFFPGVFYGTFYSGWAFAEEASVWGDPTVHADVIWLPKPPAQAVTSIQYIDQGGNLQTLDPSKYQVDLDAELPRVRPTYGNIWPIVRPILAAVTIVYTAGYGSTTNTVPEGIKTAMKLLINGNYQYRESMSPGTITKIPMGVEALLTPYWTGEYK